MLCDRWYRIIWVLEPSSETLVETPHTVRGVDYCLPFFGVFLICHQWRWCSTNIQKKSSVQKKTVFNLALPKPLLLTHSYFLFTFYLVPAYIYYNPALACTEDRLLKQVNHGFPTDCHISYVPSCIHNRFFFSHVS